MKNRWAWACLLAALLLGSAGCEGQMESRYSSYEQAVKAGAVEAGWLPAVIPAEATNLREAHDPNTQQVWVSFDIPLELAESFHQVCTPISFDEVQLPAAGPRWWDEQSLKDPWNAFFVCGDPASLGYLAVLGSGEQVYYWSYR
jgi:hypothetical protein